MITIEGKTSLDEAKIGEVGIEKSVLSTGQPLVVIAAGLCEDAHFTVHGMKGNLLQSATISTGEERVSIAVNDLAPGVYIYSIRSATQKFFGQFIIK